MSCKFIKGDGFTAFQCTPDETYGLVDDDQNKRPYQDGECRHSRTFELHGELRCRDCTATYNEITLEWEIK